MPDEKLPETLPEVAPAEPTLRYPNLPASHFRNIIDPESPTPPGEQVAAYRRAHPRLPV